ncbi:MAG: ribokinase [Chitinispirillia bacterium]|jgi:ribokinase
MTIKICNFGSLNIDHVYSVESFVRPGETVSCKTYKKFAGGKGLNQSIACARAGARVYHAGAIGADGKFLREELQNSGVVTEFVKTVKEPTGHAVIQVNRRGENSIIIYGGANRCIKRADVDEVFTGFDSGDILLVQSETNIVSSAISKAHDKGMKIILNPSPAAEELKDLPLEEISFLVLNEIEGEFFTGHLKPDEIIENLCKRYDSTWIILTMGSKGVKYGRGDYRSFIPAFRVTPVDTTAAGDTFTGYLTASVAANMPIHEAILLSSKAAAICVTRHGTAPSIPKINEVNSYKI